MSHLVVIFFRKLCLAGVLITVDLDYRIGKECNKRSISMGWRTSVLFLLCYNHAHLYEGCTRKDISNQVKMKYSISVRLSKAGMQDSLWAAKDCWVSAPAQLRHPAQLFLCMFLCHILSICIVNSTRQIFFPTTFKTAICENEPHF